MMFLSTLMFAAIALTDAIEISRSGQLLRVDYFCSGHGSYDYSTGRCTCKPGYIGSSCQTRPPNSDHCYYPVESNGIASCSWFSTCAQDAMPSCALNPNDAFAFKFCKALMSSSLTSHAQNWANDAIRCMKNSIASTVFFAQSNSCGDASPLFHQTGEDCITRHGTSNSLCIIARNSPEEGKDINNIILSSDFTSSEQLAVLAQISDDCFSEWVPTLSPTKHPTTRKPTKTESPTKHPTTRKPTRHPTTKYPTKYPTTRYPTKYPTTRYPTKYPTPKPSCSPTKSPTVNQCDFLSPYGRGAGRSPCTGCTGCSGCSWRGCSGCSGCSSCSTSHCRSNEDVWGLLCYPKCRAGFKAWHCCLCICDRYFWMTNLIPFIG